MDKIVYLKNGTEITIREMHLPDIDRIMDFFTSLPPEDREYLRIDVTNRALVEDRIQDAMDRKDFRITAVQGNRIIGTGALEFSRDDWHKKQGEMRIIIARDYQRQGLGLIMSKELHTHALENGVEKLVVKIMKPQVGAIRMVRKLGFRKEGVLHGYVMDQSAHDQDLVILTCTMKDFWKDLKLNYEDSDWRRCR